MSAFTNRMAYNAKETFVDIQQLFIKIVSIYTQTDISNNKQYNNNYIP